MANTMQGIDNSNIDRQKIDYYNFQLRQNSNDLWKTVFFLLLLVKMILFSSVFHCSTRPAYSDFSQCCQVTPDLNNQYSKLGHFSPQKLYKNACGKTYNYLKVHEIPEFWHRWVKDLYNLLVNLHSVHLVIALDLDKDVFVKQVLTVLVSKSTMWIHYLRPLKYKT